MAELGAGLALNSTQSARQSLSIGSTTCTSSGETSGVQSFHSLCTCGCSSGYTAAVGVMDVMNLLCHPSTSKQLWLVAVQGVAWRKGAPLTHMPGKSSFSICISTAEPKAAGMTSAENGPSGLSNFWVLSICTTVISSWF